MSEQEHAARPATYTEIFASGEYRAVFSASALSWIGDFAAKAAVTAMVYRQTGSVPLSAAAFAISYLPWLIGGPVLAALAERYPNRTVMVTADLIRAGLITLVAVPGLPVAAILALLLLTAMLNPPFEAARSALLPRILSGERYVGAMALQSTVNQAALIIGFMLGGTMAAFSPRLALLVDAATFAFSAFVVGLAVHARRPALAPAQRTYLLRETADGFRLVFSNPLLRAIAVLVFGTALFAPVPEGLAAAWAGHLSSDIHQQGWMQGLIMIGNATGFAVGSVLFARLVSPGLRHRLIRAFAVLVPLALTPAVVDPPVGVVALLGFVCGIAVAAFFPAVNGLFVQALPNAFRARAFGIMQSGTQVLQGAVILATGELARLTGVPVIVGLWGMGGVVIMMLAVAAWPSRQRIDSAIAVARTANELAEAEPTAPPAPVGDAGAAPSATSTGTGTAGAAAAGPAATATATATATSAPPAGGARTTAAAGAPVTSTAMTGATTAGAAVTSTTTAGPPATGATMTGATMTGATMTGATATGAPVTSAVTTGAPVTSATATGAPVTSAAAPAPPAVSGRPQNPNARGTPWPRVAPAGPATPATTARHRMG